MYLKLRHLLQYDVSIASLAIVSPAWLPYLQLVSNYAALIAPILGVIWLLVQIWAKVYKEK